MRRLRCIVLAAWLASPGAAPHAQATDTPTVSPNAVAAPKVSLTRRYVYDAHQRLCKVIEPETGARVIAYDAGGNPVSTASGLALPSTKQCDTTHPTVAARRVVRTYDARNRVATLRFPDGRGDTDYRYTHGGRLASMTTANGGGDVVGSSYTYNHRGWPTSEQGAWGATQWTLRHAYDRNGHVASLTYPDGLVVRFAPDALGRPTRVGDFATGIRWFPNGAVKQFTYGNGIVHALVQNTRGLPDRRRDALGAVVALDDHYDYDGNGNVVAISDGLGGRGHRTMAYDGLDRLRSVVSPMFGSATYAYDALDNPTRHRITGGNAPRDHHYCYDASWRLTNVKTGSCAGASVVGLAYDVQGNLSNRNGVVHAFDFGNRLRSVGGSPASHYLYDGHGRRVRDTTTGTKDSLYSLAGQLAYTRDLRAGKTRHYLHLQDRLVATRDIDHATGAIAHRYLHTDALGSTVAVTDAQRRLVERTEYEPYGRASNRPAKDGPAYTGHVEDAATGLIYAQQRYYNPVLGIFTSVDPVTAYSSPFTNFCRYCYARNNPYRFIDPDGRDAADRAYGAVVAYMLRNDPERLRIWAGGEAAATTEGSAAEQGAAMGQAAGDFVDSGDYSGAAVAGAVVKGMAAGVTRGKYKPGGRFSPSTKRGAAERAGGECEYCGVKTVPGQKSERGITPPKNEAATDHIEPRSKGGTNSPDNAAHACRECNGSFSDKPKPPPARDDLES